MNILGAKKGQQQAQKPHIAKDDLTSVERFHGLYGLAEGEIYGLADGGKSIKLDGTPLINANGTPNFADVSWEFRTGTQDQSYIAGFPSVENETRVGVELRSDTPFVRAITNRELSAVRIRLNFNALREQKDNGDITGYAIEYAFDVQVENGAFVEVLRDGVRGKSSSGFKKSHRINLPNAGTAKRWTIRVRRLTANRNSELIGDIVHIDAITEIIDAKLRYPNTALFAVTYNAKTFSNVAKIALRLKGKIIQVPTNYDPITRTYTGLWDGTFKMAYSNNPAWVFYDLCTHKRYGLGERLSGLVDKWRLYQIGQYCDESVSDGKGGTEPRFAINVYIQKADDAYRVLQNIASTFRGMSFWDGSQIVLDSDTPKDPVYTFSPANVVGEFVYQGTRARDRHNFVRVAWDNPDNNYQTEYEPVSDDEAIAKDGVRTLEINAFGCTSQGQAQRAGKWALKAEQLETQTVSFKTGLMGFIPQVGQVINIADNVFAGRAVSGRILAVNGKQITLDRTAGKVGDTLTVNTGGQVQTAKIVSVRGDTLTLDKAVGTVDDVWAVISDDLKLMQFRILTIVQNDDATFDITALEYNAQKYQVVDNGASIAPQPFTVLKATPITAPNSVTLTASTRTVQGQAVTTLNINWEQVQGATAYIVEWRKDDGNWQTLPKVSGQSVDIDGVYAGKYTARVRAVDSYDNESLATSSQLTAIAGKTGKPPRLASLTVQGILFGMNLGWGFNKGSEDTNFTEIQVSPDGRSNITTLGTFAYPTNKHEITGLQGGLTQFYRGRIVDKLGNTSDWTAWVRGVTENNAEKVLNLISGQINESHLHQNLSTPIAKIGTLETDLNGVKTQIPNIRNEINNAKTSLQNAIDTVNSQLPTLNSQIATLNNKATNLQNELNTAKSTLQTAVNNITTERNRINTAIRDIGALQTANNAKTQELANLTQTVNGHTSSIRELGVTTGDLSQKYTALKTATDTANSEITAIKQTQNGQATSIERLGAKFDNLAVGGRNYAEDGNFNRGMWLSSKHANSDATFSKENSVLSINGTNTNWKQWQIHSKEGTRANLANTSSALALLQDGETYTLSVEARSDSDTGGLINLKIADDRVAGSTPARIDIIGKSNITLTTEWKRYFVTGIIRKSAEHNVWRIILEAHGATQPVYFRNVKLEKGSIPTDWTPAPEDVQADIDNKATTANLDNLRQTLTNADTALSGQITAMDTAYKSADRTLTANLTSEQTARTSADTALGQRIDTLQTDYNGNKASVANQLKTLSDKDTATASQISSLTANVTTAQNTANTASSKADTATTKADNAQRTANDAISRANTANSAITAEQRARADGDSSLASQISALDTAYKTADSQLSGRITTAQQTATNAQNAVASVQSELTAKFDSLAVGGRNLLKNSQAERTVSNATTRELFIPYYVLTKPLEPNTAYVLSFEYKTTDNAKTAQVGFVSPVGQHKFKTDLTKTTDWQKGVFKFTTGNNANQAGHIRFDNEGTTDGQSASLWVRNAKLELGSIPTDYTPAPEDLQTAIDDKASTASLNEFKRTSANSDTALGERITAIDTAYKQADTATNAKLANAEKAISDNNTALSQRITALDTAYKSADNNLTARLAREETARASGDNANAQALRTLESTVNGIGGRVGTSESKIASLERTTSDLNGAIATTQSQLNARFDNLKIGGRNLILGSQISRTTHGTTNLAISQNIDFGNVMHLVLSCDVRFANAQRATTQGARWFRIGAEIRLVWTDGTSNWYGAWRSNVTNGTSFDGRVEHKIAIPTGKTLQAIDSVKIQIWDITGENMLVKNPKLELGTIATDWAPAPEDLQVEINSTNAKLDEFKSTQTTKDLAISQQITAMDTAYKSADRTLTANLTSEQTARTSADNALGQRIDSLQTDYNGNKASVANQLKTLSDKDTATASQISQLTANVTTAQNTANTANGKADTATTKADNAQRTANDAVSRANTANSAITAEQRARADADTALGQRITAIDTAYKSADSQTVAKLGQIEQSISDKDRAIAQRVDTLNANYTALDNRTKWVELTAVTDLNTLTETGKYFIKNTNNPNSPTPPHWLFVEVDKGTNERIKQTVIQDNNVKNQWVRHCLGGNWGQWEKVATGSDLNQKADAVALNSLTTKVNQVDGKITAEAQKISTLQTTVNGQTTSIQQQATSIDGLKAQYTVKIDSGGRVSGFGLASGGGVSDFSVRADKFLIAPPSGNGKGDSPFMVVTTPTNINGTVVPSGTYIKDAYIANGSIDVAKINKASIASLSALTANIGHFKSAESGARLEIKDSVLLVYDDNNRLRVRLGVW